MLEYIWAWFQRLTDWRQVGFDIGALSHLEIEAWARLMRIEIFPSEVEGLRQLDRTTRNYYAKKREPEKVSISDQLRGMKEAHEAAKKLEEQRKLRKQ